MRKSFEKKKKRRTYTELNQIHLLNEFVKARNEKLESNNRSCESRESIKYPTRSSSNDAVKCTISHQKMKPKSNLPRISWSEYVSSQYKRTRREAIESSKSHKLMKRNEYGRIMSSVNRVNQQCQKLHKKLNCSNNNNGDTGNSQKNHATDTKVPIVNEVKRNYSKASKSSSNVVSVMHPDVELEMKLECMQIRHENDKMKVERMRTALMNERQCSKS